MERERDGGGERRAHVKERVERHRPAPRVPERLQRLLAQPPLREAHEALEEALAAGKGADLCHGGQAAGRAGRRGRGEAELDFFGQERVESGVGLA